MGAGRKAKLASAAMRAPISRAQGESPTVSRRCPSATPMLCESGRFRAGDRQSFRGWAETVTSGIVSARSRRAEHRRLRTSSRPMCLHQRPGNSGGALREPVRGDLIGIKHGRHRPPAGGNVGIGFAVPSNMVRAVMNQIVKYGEVRRGRIGLTHPRCLCPRARQGARRAVPLRARQWSR